MNSNILDRIADGRTDLVFDYLAEGRPANSFDRGGASLITWCAYYGDVSAIRFLLSHGEALDTLGPDLGLAGAAFHGHWQLCQFLIENGADVNRSEPDTGETALHAALCKANRPAYDLVLKVLLANGANPNCSTKPNVETGSFMRDCRTKGETPLHRAAAFGTEEAIQLLLDAGSIVDAKDMHGDSPLTWASWHLRPASILRKLCYRNYTVHPEIGQPTITGGAGELWVMGNLISKYKCTRIRLTNSSRVTKTCCHACCLRKSHASMFWPLSMGVKHQEQKCRRFQASVVYSFVQRTLTF